MKRLDAALLLGVLLSFAVACDPAFARGGGGGHSGGGHSGGGRSSGGGSHGSHHHGGHFNQGGGGGVYIGDALWPYYYPPLYYYYAYPAVYAEQPYAPGYIEPDTEQPYWYYCYDPQGYYPTVLECPGGWLPVAP